MKETHYTSPYELEGRLPLGEAVLLGLQHVLAMFASNLTPILLIAGACGISAGDPLQVVLLQNAMIIAGVVTLVRSALWADGFRSLWAPVPVLSAYAGALRRSWAAVLRVTARFWALRSSAAFLKRSLDFS